MIRHLEPAFLAHSLHLADDFADKALLNQFRRKRCLERNGDTAIALAVVALLLGDRHLDILGRDRNIAVRKMQRIAAAARKRILHRSAVAFLKGLLDRIHLLADLRAEHAEVRLHMIGEEVRHIIAERHCLDIQLILDDRNEELGQSMLRLDKHVGNRLTVLDVCRVARRTAERHNREHDLHVLLELRVNPRLVHRREIRKVNGDRCGLVNRADEVAVDAFRDKRNQRCCRLHRRHERRIERQIGICLILLHALRPETAAAAAHIPVRQLFNKGLQCLCRLSNAIVCEAVIHRPHHRAHA